MFVGTWNVGGRAPHGGLDLSDWLTDDGPDSSSPHIYVLGYVSFLYVRLTPTYMACIMCFLSLTCIVVNMFSSSCKLLSSQHLPRSYISLKLSSERKQIILLVWNSEHSMLAIATVYWTLTGPGMVSRFRATMLIPALSGSQSWKQSVIGVGNPLCGFQCKVVHAGSACNYEQYSYEPV
jgi:hypothetical protein